jgi:asparagine synthase (glutamine-hydrolysing)
MCGIVGSYGRDGVVPDIAAGLACLAHRGPDDEGHWSERNDRVAVALAARRLAIIDREGGHQPLGNEDGQVVAVQNGEIYNYRELMAELERRGHRFRSRSDTEVLVHAWEEWGDRCPEHLRGMFALAIYDRRRQTLFLARDRFGIKPLFYSYDRDHFVFASELPALRRLLPMAPRLNVRPLARLLSLGWVPGPETLYEGVFHLPPAHALRLTPAGMQLWRYWQPTPPPAAELQRPRHPGETLQALMLAVVDLHRRSDVPVGALLSGGLDSSLLVALLHRLDQGELQAFSLGFADPAYDESDYARVVAGHLGVRHYRVRFDDDAMTQLPRLVVHYGQPVGSATHIAIALLFAACAAQGLRVVLTGEGADELFGGYPWYRGETQLALLRGLPTPWRQVATALARRWRVSAAAAELLRRSDLSLPERYRRWLSPHSPQDALSWLHPDLRPQIDTSLPWTSPGPDLHPLHALTLLDLQSRLPDFINLEVDRMSMASSVEARVPFLDHGLWETVMGWDPALNRPYGREKALERQAARGLLPLVIRRRRKQGLAAPHARWWRQPRLPAWAEACLTPAALAATGLFHPPAVLALRTAHREGCASYATPLTAILTTQLWLQQETL